MNIDISIIDHVKANWCNPQYGEAIWLKDYKYTFWTSNVGNLNVTY